MVEKVGLAVLGALEDRVVEKVGLASTSVLIGLVGVEAEGGWVEDVPLVWAPTIVEGELDGGAEDVAPALALAVAMICKGLRQL